MMLNDVDGWRFFWGVMLLFCVPLVSVFFYIRLKSILHVVPSPLF